MVERQVPKPRELIELMHFKKPTFDAKQRRLQKALTIEDLRQIAKRRTPKAAFEYVDGGSEREITLTRARQAFQDVEFRPRALRDVSKVDTSTTILGGNSSLPFAIAPTGCTRLMHTEGEVAGCSAAGAAGIPFTLSTMGTTSIEGVQAANPLGRNWFQLYVTRSPELTNELIDRAERAGFDSLIVTVDTPIVGARYRDTRNGYSIPPQLTAKNVLDVLPRPWWWWDFLTTPILDFENLATAGAAMAQQMGVTVNPTASFDDVRAVRERWEGPLAIKGVQSVEDAKRFVDLGVDGLVLSNHGGRQFDQAPVPFHVLPEVVREVGSHVEVGVDTGIMHGADIVAALAVGARFTLVGRAYLYGLMAGGREGVDRAIEILRGQIERTMTLLGVASIEELEPSHVVQLRRLVPLA